MIYFAINTFWKHDNSCFKGGIIDDKQQTSESTTWCSFLSYDTNSVRKERAGIYHIESLIHYKFIQKSFLYWSYIYRMTICDLAYESKGLSTLLSFQNLNENKMESQLCSILTGHNEKPLCNLDYFYKITLYSNLLRSLSEISLKVLLQ